MIKSNGSDYFKRELCFFVFGFGFGVFGFGWKDGNGRVGFEQRVRFGFGFGVKNERKLDMSEIGESVACEVGDFF